MLDLDFTPVFASSHQLLSGAVTTVVLAFAGMALALLFGVVAAAFASTRSRWLRRFITAYVDIFRGTPLLVQIIAAFYLPALLGFHLSPVFVGIVALAAYYGAYVTEIVRAGVGAIPRGQIVAASALGISAPLIFKRIVLPQVFAIVMSPITGQFVNLIKATSLLSLISIQELTLKGRIIIIQTVAPLETYLVIAALYLVINSAIATGSVRLERRLRRHL